jgi:hypothetical protein
LLPRALLLLFCVATMFIHASSVDFAAGLGPRRQSSAKAAAAARDAASRFVAHRGELQ